MSLRTASVWSREFALFWQVASAAKCWWHWALCVLRWQSKTLRARSLLYRKVLGLSVSEQFRKTAVSCSLGLRFGIRSKKTIIVQGAISSGKTRILHFSALSQPALWQTRGKFKCGRKANAQPFFLHVDPVLHCPDRSSTVKVRPLLLLHARTLRWRAVFAGTRSSDFSRCFSVQYDEADCSVWPSSLLHKPKSEYPSEKRSMEDRYNTRFSV